LSSSYQTSVTIDLGGAQIALTRAEIFEAIGEPYIILLDVLSQLDEIDLLPHLGKWGIIKVFDNAIGIEGQREAFCVFDGILTEGEYLGERPGGFAYRLTLKPKTYLKDQNRAYLIWQDLSAKELILNYLSAGGKSAGLKIIDKTERETPKRIYCVQYGESDFQFISRLMEEEGIYYYFNFSEDGHYIVLNDSPNAHTPHNPQTLLYRPSSDTISNSDIVFNDQSIGALVDWQEGVRTDFKRKVSLSDYDFTKSGLDLTVEASPINPHYSDVVDVRNFPGGYSDKIAGAELANFQLEAQLARRQIFSGLTPNLELKCGSTVTLQEHSERYNKDYLIIRTHRIFINSEFESGGGGGQSTYTRFECIHADKQWRSLQTTPKPVVKGPTTAFVTGPSDEDIYTDEYGRVKVRFLWDQTQGQDPDKRSCWIRVSQTAARGTITIPRVGDEVVVDFIDGDPDRPMVVGSVFNSNYRPYYNLPDYKTKTSWRSALYKDAGDKQEAVDVKTPFSHIGVNEITFEDKGGAEELFIYAQLDLNSYVVRNQSHTIGQHEFIKIGKDSNTEIGAFEKRKVVKDSEVLIDGSSKLIIGKNLDSEIKADEKRQVGGKSDLAITGDQSVKVSGKSSQEVVGGISIKTTTDSISIEAINTISLKVGGNKIEISQSGIKIEGLMLDMAGKISAELKSTLTTVKSDAITTVKGGIVMIN
jgi:type VI secretion system secreted protein VgrG